MVGKTRSFMGALEILRQGFESSSDYDELAVIRKSPGEYQVIPVWVVKSFGSNVDWEDLTVVMMLTRPEAMLLFSAIVEEK